MLGGFGVSVTAVRRNRAEGVLGPDEWQPRLGEFDWVILTAPGTSETVHLIGAAELSAMKPDAVLVNVARAGVVDQQALTQALRERRIYAAVLDLTDPEPLPPEHELWQLENAQVTMHLAGYPTPATLARGLTRFLGNCEHFRAGQPLEAEVDFALGY
jgi:phosphoglycerate dehydrogenase-like enzyme